MIYKIVLTIWLLAGISMCIAGAYGSFVVGFFGVLLSGFSVFEFIGLNQNQER